MRAFLALLVLAGACAEPPEPPLGVLRIEAVSAEDDWFVVVNASPEPVRLSDFGYLDHDNDVIAAAPFPDVVLGPGERHRQEVTRKDAGFRLGRDEELWIWRIADERVSDVVDWEAPRASSARAQLAR